MRALLVGSGSIGMRHLNNLRSLGVGPLAIVEPAEDRQALLCGNKDITMFDNLEDGLDWGPCFVVIASPSHLHVEQSLEAAIKGCHLFIEKPLSHTSQGLDELMRAINERKLISFVGCNMRFHPGPAKVKELLDDEALGRTLFARVHTGSYLPAWRPWQDYRVSYSAKNAMGGGCLLDCIHEIDLTRWYLGEVEEVFCRADHLSSLELDVEDVAILVCKHSSGAISETHLDYVQRTYERGCQIVGEQGSIFWDYNEGCVRWFDTCQNQWKTFHQSEGWNVNQMYVDEMRHFLRCLQTGNDTTLPVREAVRLMRIVFASKESAASGRQIHI